jgi:hypothetical protein
MVILKKFKKITVTYEPLQTNNITTGTINTKDIIEVGVDEFGYIFAPKKGGNRNREEI